MTCEPLGPVGPGEARYGVELDPDADEMTFGVACWRGTRTLGPALGVLVMPDRVALVGGETA